MNHLRVQWRAAALRTLQPVKDKSRLGRCYELAAEFALAHHEEDWSVVHGRIQGTVGVLLLDPLHHAWCWQQDDDLIYEPATDAIYDGDAFEELYRAEFDNVYEPGEWQETVLHYNHYGPWDGTAPPIR